MKDYTVNEARDIVSRYFAKKGVTLDDAKETGCGDLNCSACVFYTQKRCGFNFLEKEYLARAEAELNKVGWNRVHVDTTLMVKYLGDEQWHRAYFAFYENGTIYVWRDGSTSWSAKGKKPEMMAVKCARIVEEDEKTILVLKKR